MSSSRRYTVGYGKPPKPTQFKKGISGNPKGRPPGTKKVRDSIEKELDELIEVTEKGERLLVTKRQALRMRLYSLALSGDMRAIKTILAIDQRPREESPVRFTLNIGNKYPPKTMK